MVETVLMLALLGIQSRVVINEVMANPRGPDSHAHYPEDRNEFVELYNLSDDTVDLQGWHLTDFDDVDTLLAWTDTLIRNRYPHVRTGSTRLPPHSFAVILDPEYVDTVAEGGYVQPYEFPDRVLVLRVGTTTIGSGLATSDPLMFWPPDSSEFSTFGTWPGGPDDAGDGFSWERVEPGALDDDTAWVRSIDIDGCTPGRANSISSFKDLCCREVLCSPLSFVPGVAETIRVRVANAGRVLVSGWTVQVFRDLNGNRRQDWGESLGLLTGAELARGEEDTLTCVWMNPEHGVHDLIARLTCSGDQDSSDDVQSARLELLPSERHFCLQTEQFGPGLPGYPESLGIAYSLPDSKGNLCVVVLDLNARDRALVHDGKPDARDGVLYWGGADRNGRLLPIGIYVVVCEYKSGKDVIFEKKPVVFAKGR
jgi:hypothetical protein